MFTLMKLNAGKQWRGDDLHFQRENIYEQVTNQQFYTCLLPGKQNKLRVLCIRIDRTSYSRNFFLHIVAQHILCKRMHVCAQFVNTREIYIGNHVVLLRKRNFWLDATQARIELRRGRHIYREISSWQFLGRKIERASYLHFVAHIFIKAEDMLLSRHIIKNYLHLEHSSI